MKTYLVSYFKECRYGTRIFSEEVSANSKREAYNEIKNDLDSGSMFEEMDFGGKTGFVLRQGIISVTLLDD